MRKLIATATLFFLAAPAWAGTWEHTFYHLAVGGPANFFGTATKSTDSNGNEYTSFAASGSLSATGEFIVPSFLTSPVMSCGVNFRINSLSSTNHVRFKAAAQVTTNGTGSNWEFNDATELPTTGQSFTLNGHQKEMLQASILNIPIDNQGTSGSQCANVATCAGQPARFRIYRDDTVSSDDPAAVEIINVWCVGTTS